MEVKEDEFRFTSTITQEQIRKIQDLLGARLELCRFPSEPTEWVLKTRRESLTFELVNLVNEYVKEASKIIVCHRVPVEHNLYPGPMLFSIVGDLSRMDIDCDVMVNMPKNMPERKDEEMDVYFFKFSTWEGKSDDELEEEYTLRRLTPVDLCTLIAVHRADPSFMDVYRNTATHWKDKDNRWCYAAFSKKLGERYVEIGIHTWPWCGVYPWWFAGLRR